jgi:hypothetical protein
MASADEFDEDDFLSSLSQTDQSRFKNRFSEEYNNIDQTDAERAVKNSFRQNDRRRHGLFTAVVNSFASGESDFEVAFVDPLREIVGESPIDVLLARDSYHGTTHLCAVFCEPKGENPLAQNVNSGYELLERNIGRVKSQLSSTEIGTVQYATLIYEEELSVIRPSSVIRGAEPDEYSIWVMDETTTTLEKEAGRIAHEDLRNKLEGGIDYTKLENYEIEYGLDSHDVIILQNVILDLVAGSKYENDEREFNEEDFREGLLQGTEIGPDEEDKEEMVDKRVEELLEFAIESKMLYTIEDDQKKINSGRDYRARFPQGNPSKVKDSILEKYSSQRAPQRRGRIAFTRAKDRFEPVDTDLDDFK